MRNILHEHSGVLAAKGEWVGPLTLVATIGTTLAVGVKSHRLTNVLIFVLGLSVFWLCLAVRKALRYGKQGGIDSIIRALRPTAQTKGE